MSNDLKRVGLIFDTEGNVDFKKTLTSINGSLQENRNQFKLTKAQWDDSTKASQKLKDTMEYLNNQYKDSSQKVKVLRSELDELESAENKDEAAIRKKRNALIAAETTMINYKKGVDEVSVKLKAGTADIEEYAKKIGDFGKKATDVGKGLTKGLTAPILAIGAGALVAWNKMDEAYDNIITKTGATGEALSDLQNSFDTVYGSMPEESMDVSNAIGEVNTRFKVTGKELESLTTYMLEYAKITGTDVVDAIKQAQFIQGNWNLTNKETKDVLGLVAKKAQETGISADVLMDSINKNSAVFKEMDLSVGEAVSLMAEFEASGLDSTQMMMGLKKAASNYAKEGKTMSTGLGELISRLKDASTNQEATTEAIGLFGSKSGLAFAKAASEGRINLDSLSGDLNKYSKTVSDTYESTLDPMDKAKIAQNNLELASSKLGDIIQSALGPVFEMLADVLKSVSEGFDKLSPSMKTAIVVIGAILLAIGPLLIMFGMITTGISSVMGLFASFSLSAASAGAGVGILGGSVSALIAPILAVIAVIALIVAAFVQLWNTNDQFKKSVETAINSIMVIFNTLWSTVLQPIFETIKNLLIDIWDNGIKPLWDKFVEFIGGITMKLSELLVACQPVIDFFIQTFGPIITTIFQLVGDTIGNVVNTILGVLGGLLGNVGQIFGGIIDIFKGIIDFIVGVFSGNWSLAWSGIVSIFSGIWDTIVGVVKTPINLVIGLINGMVGAIQNGVNFVIGGINSISFKVPKWVPGIGGKKFGFDLDKVSFGRIEYLAKGGNLLHGSAIVGEAGPELLTQKGNRTSVSPLSRGGGANPVELIDYDKLALAFIKYLKNIKLYVGDDEMGQFVDRRILRAVK